MSRLLLSAFCHLSSASCLLPPASCFLFLFTAHCPQLTAHCSKPTVHCHSYCLLPAHCVLPTATALCSMLLLTAHCPLSTLTAHLLQPLSPAPSPYPFSPAAPSSSPQLGFERCCYPIPVFGVLSKRLFYSRGPVFLLPHSFFGTPDASMGNRQIPCRLPRGKGCFAVWLGFGVGLVLFADFGNGSGFTHHSPLTAHPACLNGQSADTLPLAAW